MPAHPGSTAINYNTVDDISLSFYVSFFGTIRPPPTNRGVANAIAA